MISGAALKRLLLAMALLLPGIASAQTVPNGGIQSGQTWSVLQWNSAWASKLDKQNGSATNLTVGGLNLGSSQVSGNPVFTGTPNFSSGGTLGGNFGGTLNLTGAAPNITLGTLSTFGLAMGNQTPVAGSVLKEDWLLENNPDFPLKDEGAIWSTQAYCFFCVSKEFTSSSLPGSGSGSPSAAVFGYAVNNGSDADVTAVIGDAVARQNNSVVFGGNLIARSGGGSLSGLKLVGAEIDVDPASGDAVSAGGGLFINAFNKAMPIPGIFIGSNNSGTFGNGLIIGGISSNGAGIAAQANAAMNSLLDASADTSYTTAAIILGNGSVKQSIQFDGTSGTANAARIYADSSNNLRLVQGIAGLAVRNQADTTNELYVDASGNTTANGYVKGAYLESSNGTYAAAGTTQGTATLVNVPYAQVTSGTGGVELPQVLSAQFVIWNLTASALNVYPFSGAQIDSLGANVPHSVAAGAVYHVVCLTSTQCRTD